MVVRSISNAKQINWEHNDIWNPLIELFIRGQWQIRLTHYRDKVLGRTEENVNRKWRDTMEQRKFGKKKEWDKEYTKKNIKMQKLRNSETRDKQRTNLKIY